MILDKFNEFCDAVSVAAAAGTVLIGNVIDLGAKPANFGISDQMYLVIQTDVEVITAGAAGTIQFKLASDAQAAIAVDGSATDHIITAALVTDGTDANAAQLKAGQNIFVGRLPAGTYERYLGILRVIATTTTTAGSISAFITSDVSQWEAFADAAN